MWERKWWMRQGSSQSVEVDRQKSTSGNLVIFHYLYSYQDCQWGCQCKKSDYSTSYLARLTIDNQSTLSRDYPSPSLSISIQ